MRLSLFAFDFRVHYHFRSCFLFSAEFAREASQLIHFSDADTSHCRQPLADTLTFRAEDYYQSRRFHAIADTISPLFSLLIAYISVSVPAFALIHACHWLAIASCPFHWASRRWEHFSISRIGFQLSFHMMLPSCAMITDSWCFSRDWGPLRHCISAFSLMFQPIMRRLRPFAIEAIAEFIPCRHIDSRRWGWVSHRT